MAASSADRHDDHRGAYRSAQIMMRCQRCEQPATSHCGHCGHTYCAEHAPVDRLCPDCHQTFKAEINRKQGRFWEGMGIVLLSLVLLGAGAAAGGGLMLVESIPARILGVVLLIAAGLAPIWVLLGRERISQRLFRRIR